MGHGQNFVRFGAGRTGHLRTFAFCTVCQARSCSERVLWADAGLLYREHTKAIVVHEVAERNKARKAVSSLQTVNISGAHQGEQKMSGIPTGHQVFARGRPGGLLLAARGPRGRLNFPPGVQESFLTKIQLPNFFFATHRSLREIQGCVIYNNHTCAPQ
jgi:hypothetical protein